MTCCVLIDFDGTIALKDTTDAILEKFAKPQWQIIEDLWRAGKIGSRSCMMRQISLLSASEAELDAFIDGFEIDPGFYSIIYFCKVNNFSLAIVSDGLDRVIKRVLFRLGIHNVKFYANTLVYLGHNQWKLGFPHFMPHCLAQNGTCKCAVSKLLQADSSKFSILIGDGQSDFCTAHDVDLVFAKAKLADYCKKYQIRHKTIASLNDVNKYFFDLGHELRTAKKIEHVFNRAYYGTIKESVNAFQD